MSTKDFTVRIAHTDITHPNVARIGKVLYIRIADYDIPVDLQKELHLTDGQTREMLTRLDEQEE